MLRTIPGRYLFVPLLAVTVGMPLSLFAEETAQQPAIRFNDVTSPAGVVSIPTTKYGGPCVFDLERDGDYDFVLGNHDQTPIQLFVAESPGSYRERLHVLFREDVHGLAAGDYDRDGDADLIVAIGGGNGAKPKPPRLLRNDGAKFTDVTDTCGIANLGARGRSVRWVDLDGDGDLDLLQLNAKKVVTEPGPQNILFENTGDGKFTYRESPSFDAVEAEKVHITDFDQDGVPDLITCSNWGPVQFWRGDGHFGFVDVSEAWLPARLRETRGVFAIAEADIDNDGVPDYYLARGGDANEGALAHDAERLRLDLRDRGKKGHRGITFTTPTWRNAVDLRDFAHAARGPDQGIPLFLGEQASRRPEPRQVLYVSEDAARGMPAEQVESGWYLGYLGDKRWRLEWRMHENLAWSLSASVIGVESAEPDFEPTDPREPDVLLRNTGERFEDLSYDLPNEARDNNRGVVAGDFDNDGDDDFFVFRYGELKRRVLDFLLLNQGEGRFTVATDHGATDLNEDAHGDMGAAFDHDQDGRLDLLVGNDDNGAWRLYQNNTPTEGNYLLVQVGNSPNGADPQAAEVTVRTVDGREQTKRVNAGASAFSQCELTTLHFGLGTASRIAEVSIRWRDGGEQSQQNVPTNQLVRLPKK